MNRLKQFAKTLWQDESGQGMAEYILLVTVIVGLIVAVGPRIKQAVLDKMSAVETGIQSVE